MKHCAGPIERYGEKWCRRNAPAKRIVIKPESGPMGEVRRYMNLEPPCNTCPLRQPQEPDTAPG